MKNFKDSTKFPEIVENSMQNAIVADSEDEIVENEIVADSENEIVADSMDIEMVEDSMDEQGEEDLEIVEDSMDEQDDEEHLEIDLNIPADNGLDLNKFPDSEDDSSDEKEHKEEIRKLRRIYLSKFY
jgi:hypothetical protein